MFKDLETHEEVRGVAGYGSVIIEQSFCLSIEILEDFNPPVIHFCFRRLLFESEKGLEGSE